MLNNDFLPNGWCVTRLENCVDILDHKRIPVNSDEREKRISGKNNSQLFPYYGATGQVGWIDGYIFDGINLLLGEDGAPFFESHKQKAYIIKGKSWVNNHAHVLCAKEGVATNSYLMHYLNHFDFNGFVTGTTRYKLNQGRMREIPVLLPPLEEQKILSSVIEELFSQLDAGVAALKRAQANLKRYKASVLKAACEGRLVPTEAELARREGRTYESGAELLQRILAERRRRWEEDQRAKGKDPAKIKYVEPKGPDTTGLPALPEGWVWATVEQLAAHEPNSITDGPFGSNLKTEHYTYSGVRVIRLQNIGDGVFIDNQAYISDEHFTKLRRHEIQSGDIVIAALGENLPRACIIPSFVGPAIVKADCIRLKPHNSLNVKYIYHCLNSDPVRRFASSIIHGVGRPRLNQQEIKSLVIPLPPYWEQKQISEIVDNKMSVIDMIGIQLKEELLRAANLRQSILKQAFEGRLVRGDARAGSAGGAGSARTGDSGGLRRGGSRTAPTGNPPTLIVGTDTTAMNGEDDTDQSPVTADNRRGGSRPKTPGQVSRTAPTGVDGADESFAGGDAAHGV
jgi:type I restriction enzyme S subunit